MKKYKQQAGIVLLCGTAVAVCWCFLDKLCFLWKKCTFLPAGFYFPLEEFLALYTHRNSPFFSIGGLVIVLITLLWSFKLYGRLKKKYEYLPLLLIILLWAVILSPCLCVSREHARRMLCQSQLKKIYMTCELYAQEHNNAFPATIDNGSLRHKVYYYGKDQKRIMPRFILLEDAEYCHAGDMRHRIWSDGEIEYFYPWKK